MIDQQSVQTQEPVVLSLVIPVYNEQDSVYETIRRCLSMLDSLPVTAEVILVDDGSEDATSEVLNEYSQFVRILKHPTNLGYGAAIKTGVRHCSGQWVAIADADGTYPIEELPKLFSLTDHVDMIVGARPRHSLPMIRRPAKWFIRSLANYVAQRSIPDLNSGFRIFRADLFKKYLSMLPDGFSLTTTITLAMHSDGFRVDYTPIEYGKRVGKSKIHPLRDPYNFIMLIMRICLYFNPLRVFGPMSVLLFLLGTGVLIYSKVFTEQIMDITVMVLYFVSLQMIVLGMLGDLVVRRSRGSS